MARPKQPTGPKPVDSLRHQDKRANIPTNALRGFVEGDESQPGQLLYPRDESLDPQLVWNGKDEQDRQPLEVPVVPIYIQEKILPQVIIENLRDTARKGEPEPEMTLFNDFNGIEFRELVEFYQHEQNWSNRMILGDSLLVMTSLAEKEGLKGKVQMIYIDPPYGIKFGSNWQVSTRKRDVKDGKAEDAVRQPEQIKAFRDTWEYGIHSYLTYLRDRFTVARELLSGTGSVFVQIGDENVHLVRSLLDEVFGSENFISQVHIVKTAGQTDALLASLSDTLLWYAKNREAVKYRQLHVSKGVGFGEVGQYYYADILSEGRRRLTEAEISGSESLPADSRPFRISDISSNKFYSEGRIPFHFEGRVFLPPAGRFWTHRPDGRNRLGLAGRLYVVGNSLRFAGYLGDFGYALVANQWSDTGVSGYADPKVYVVQTNTKVVERCLLMTTDPGDLVLDPTCGSGTAAYVAEHWGRRWITIDTSRVALALARTRMMAAKFPYYHLADTSEGYDKEQELSATPVPAPERKFGTDIRKGFVYKRVPHVTLKSIANNEEIDVIHAKWQEKLEPLRKELNKALKQSWEEWQVPREADAKWSDRTKQAHREWWRLRRDRQQEIDASIAKRADTELLYDQPYEDNKRIRVTGPFTVESLSPHRVLATDEERPKAESEQVKAASGQFETMIVDNLKRAGVKSTDKKFRIAFDRLEPFAGTWLHASGEFTETETGKRKRIAVSIGPEHGTVGPEQVKEAAKEAVLGVGFDVLVVCGFAFDPHVREETRRYGKLVVLPALMNPDLSMGEELLKKTGAANLFMVFGEPDVAPVDAKTGKLQPQKDGKYVIEIRGVDVYDPTTGEIRSNKTDDIACWFIDTDYNGESFFVRHAYFCGDQEPYDRLKRALRAEIDEAAWSALYLTKSIPFDKPKSGKVAIKVINHYGDEVLKVLTV